MLLCELLIEIILESKKDELSNELILNILALWADYQLITINNTMGLIQTSKEADPYQTKILLTKLGLTPFSDVVEVEATNG